MENFRKRKWRFSLQFDRLLCILLIKPKSEHEESCIQDVLNTLVHRIVRGSTLPGCPSSGFRCSRFRRTEKDDASCGKGCHPLAEEPVHVLLISFCRDAHEDTGEMRKTLCPLAQDAPTSLSMEYLSLSWGENLKKKIPFLRTMVPRKGTVENIRKNQTTHKKGGGRITLAPPYT